MYFPNGAMKLHTPTATLHTVTETKASNLTGFWVENNFNKGLGSTSRCNEENKENEVTKEPHMKTFTRKQTCTLKSQCCKT